MTPVNHRTLKLHLLIPGSPFFFGLSGRNQCRHHPLLSYINLHGAASLIKIAHHSLDFHFIGFLGRTSADIFSTEVLSFMPTCVSSDAEHQSTLASPTLHICPQPGSMSLQPDDSCSFANLGDRLLTCSHTPVDAMVHASLHKTNPTRST